MKPFRLLHVVGRDLPPFGHRQLRAHRLAIMRELARERRIDGLELNFMRWAKHFERDRGPEKAPLMTEFVGQIHHMLTEAATERGTDRLLLGVRVPSTIHECLLAGCDVAAWIRRGYLDYVVPCEHNSTWPGLNVEQFAEPARGTDCEVYAMMGDMIGGAWQGKPPVENRPVGTWSQWTGYQTMLNTPEEARAAAMNYYTWGAQGIGFWNIPNNCNPLGFGKHNQYERMLSWVLDVIDPDRVRSGQRRYHYVPIYKRHYIGVDSNYAYRECGRSPLGEFKAPVLYFNEGQTGRRLVYPFRMADGRDGAALSGTLRFRVFHCFDHDMVEVDINGTTLSADTLERTFDDADSDLPWTWFTIDLAACPPFVGDNELGLTWQSERQQDANVPYMEELDVRVEPARS